MHSSFYYLGDWRTRCNVKYSSSQVNAIKSVSHIAFIVTQVVRQKFNKINNLYSTWEYKQLLYNNISYKKIITVTWIKPPVGYVKLNSYGNCIQGVCGGHGIIRGSEGYMIYACTIKIGERTSNLV